MTSEILNLSALCRCCHSNGEYKSLGATYTYKNGLEVYKDMLLDTLNVKIEPPPIEASYSICEECIVRLRDASKFKREVLECERKFEEYCKNELAEVIKMEFESSDDGHDYEDTGDESKYIENKLDHNNESSTSETNEASSDELSCSSTEDNGITESKVFNTSHKRYSPLGSSDNITQKASASKKINSDLSQTRNPASCEPISVPSELIRPASLLNRISTAPLLDDVAKEHHIVTQEEYCANANNTEENPRPKKEKVIRGKDYCFYCKNLVFNYARHLLRRHTYETEVQEILSYPKKSVARKNKFTELRKKGNYILNSVKVTKPMKRHKFTHYLPCTHCLGFYSKKMLWKHIKKCTGKSNKNVQSEAQNMLLRNLKVDEKLKSAVFSRMRADYVSLTAKSDVLICAFGAQYLRTHRKNHIVNVVSRKMRELAKLLIEIQKTKPSVNNFFDMLIPEYYDDIVAATKVLGKFDSKKDRFNSSSFARNLFISIKQCCKIATMMALKKQEPYAKVNTAEIEAGLKTLTQLMDKNWRNTTSSQSATDLNKKNNNKVTMIQLANDLKILEEFLIKKAGEAAKEIKEGLNNVATYIHLLEIVYCRVFLLNRRRPGELLRISVHEYLESNKTSMYEECDLPLTASERILANKFKNVIRGKRGRGIPVLFSDEVQEDIKLLLSVRDKYFSTSNKLLFGNPGYPSTINGYKVLERCLKSSGAKNPTAISSIGFRKHVATLSQILSMSENEMVQLAALMGYTNYVHKKSYRLLDVYQAAKITMLILLMEDGKTDAFKGKSLDEINLDLNEELDGENIVKKVILEYDFTEIQLCEQQECNESLPELPRHENKPIRSRAEVSLPSIADKYKKEKKRTLVPWTVEQKKVVTTFFEHHIKNKKPPKRNECDNLKNEHRELLENKDWLKIKVFIQNIYSKT